MKKMLYSVLFMILIIVLIGCGDLTTPVTSQLQTSQNTVLTTEVFTREEVTTSITTNIETTVEPTMEPTTTMIDSTTEYVEASIELNYVYSGKGTLNKPYLISIEEGQSTKYQINITPSNADVDYQVGQIINDAFIPADPAEIQGISLDGSNMMFFSIQAIFTGKYDVKITANDQASVYVSIDVKEIPVDFTKTLKVLAIGNSFSVDGMEYLYKIADSWGIEEIVLGNLYIGGASLATHVDSIKNDQKNYVYYKNDSDQWVYQNTQATVLDGLIDEDWDIISIQQVSHLSGVPSSYNSDLEYLINYINEHKTNSRAKIVWHMTWAYQSDSTHGGFTNYNNDQMEMYNAIIGAVESNILTNDQIEYVIPSGTSIQNLRTSFVGDNLTRDGFHLDLGIGRYTASLTWFKQITGLSLNFVGYYPDDMTIEEFEAVLEAVNQAVAHPFIITQFSDE